MIILHIVLCFRFIKIYLSSHFTVIYILMILLLYNTRTQCVPKLYCYNLAYTNRANVISSIERCNSRGQLTLLRRVTTSV